MAMQLNPYVGFRDNAREAMEFYKTVFGGELELHTFEEYHASPDGSENNKIMHAVLTMATGLVVMAADTPNSMEFNESARISLSVSGDDDATLSGYFQQLSEGGKAIMPLEKAPWGDKFGMVVDKYGVQWMVNISGAQA